MKVKHSFILILFTLISTYSVAQDLTAAGKTTFTSHCSSCHNLGSVMVGPDLLNVDKRHDINWIVNFVKSSQTVVKTGDKNAVALFDKFKIVMPDQPDLSTSDIKNIIGYITIQSGTAIVEKPPLVTPYFAKSSNLPVNKTDVGLIAFYLLLITMLIMALYFAVSVQSFKRKRSIVSDNVN